MNVTFYKKNTFLLIILLSLFFPFSTKAADPWTGLKDISINNKEDYKTYCAATQATDNKQLMRCDITVYDPKGAATKFQFDAIKKSYSNFVLVNDKTALNEDVQLRLTYTPNSDNYFLEGINFFYSESGPNKSEKGQASCQIVTHCCCASIKDANGQITGVDEKNCKQTYCDCGANQRDIGVCGIAPKPVPISGSTVDQISCGINKCTKTDKSCTNDSDCTGLSGVGLCKNNFCYLDDVGLKKYNESPSILGIQADLQIRKPILEINIPQLKFSDVKNQIDDQGFLHLPYIGEYMSAAYKVAMVIVSIIGVIMIIVVGVKITVMGGEERVNGFKRIGQISIGLFIAWGSYAILYNINPDLVNFKSLKVKYIEPQILPDYPEGPENEGQYASQTPYTGQYDANGLDKFKQVFPFTKCLMGTMDLHVGVVPPLTSITFLGRNVKINPKAVQAFKQVEKEILASPEPEMKDYVRFLQDKNAPSLHPSNPTGDKASTIDDSFAGFHCGFGYKRKEKDCTLANSPTRDMHQATLAIDLIYGSNGDFDFSPNGKKEPTAILQCRDYQKNFEKYKSKFQQYAGLAERIEKNLYDCLNTKFADGSNPFTTHPKKFIEIFKKNGFVWGGDFCNEKSFRTDGMHFEYWGTCKALRCNGRS